MIFKQCISFIVSISLLTNQMLFAGSLDLDKSATQKTSLDTAPNGVPIVNITTPNAQGLSHNKFTNYNVEQKGLILNNAVNVAQTQLGGYIASNPNLSSQSAKTILNEVTGTSRSLLNGYTEVAGQAADVIIANPNGISINGGGFINAPRVTLSTGTAELINGQISGFDIIGGDILIDGDGFNANTISQVDLYTKVLTLNAKLYAQSLNIVTGENQIASDGTIASKNAVGTGVSLDSSALGGIYAQKITLVGTDKGVGVNFPPEVLASNGSIDISADGKISFQKTTASQSINAVSLSSDIEINGALSSASNTNLTAKNSIINNSILIAGMQSDTSLNSNALLTLQAVDIINQNQISSYGTLILNALGSITNKGVLYAPNITPINTKALNNTGTLLSESALSLHIDDTLINDGTIRSEDSLNIQTTTLKNYNKINSNTTLLIDVYSLDNTGYLNADALTITTNDFTNSGTLFSAQDLFLSATGALINNGTINSGNNLTLKSNEAITNTNVIVAGLREDTTHNSSALMSMTANAILNKGSIVTYGNLSLNTGTLDNQNYLYSTKYFTATMNDFMNTGTLYSEDTLKLLIAQNASNNGIINAGQSLSIEVTEDLMNTASITAGVLPDNTYNTDASLSIKANSLTNQSKINSQGSLTLDTSTLTNSIDGYVNANNDLHVKAEQFSNAGTVFGNKHLVLTLTGDFTNDGAINGAQSVDLSLNGGFTNNGVFMSGLNHDGTYTTDASINLQASSMTNSGKISSQKDLYLTTTTFNNYNYLYATNLLQLNANSVANTGTLLSDSIFMLSINSNFNNKGTINSAKTLDMTINGVLTNNGTLSAGLYKDGTSNTNANLAIHASTLTNNSKISANGDMHITVANTITNNGYLSAYDALHVSSNTLNNYGVLFSGTDMNLWVSELLYNYENANILAIGNLIMAKDASLAKTKRIVNDKATIETIDGDMSLYAQTFENKTDGLVKGTKLIASETLNSITSKTEIDFSLLLEAKNKLISNGQYQTLVEATAKEVCTSSDSEGMCEGTEIQYNGISEKQVVVTKSYVKTWDTYSEDYPLWVTHHSQQVYDIQVVSTSDMVAELNTILSKYGLAARYGSIYGSTTTLGYFGFFYNIPDPKGGEIKRRITVSSEQEYVISQTTPAKLLSGGELTIYADNITNYLSQISSNDDMRITGNTLNNGGEVLFQIDTRTGEYYYCYKQCNSMFHDPDYTWAPLPGATTYTQTYAAYSTIYSGKSITGNLATVNNVDIKSDQAPLGHTGTTNVTPTITLDSTNVNVSTPPSSTTSIQEPNKPIIDPKTHETTITLPTGTNGLFVVSTNPKSHYLVETNPAFASFGNFIGSDYMLSRLGLNPDATTKRLGDAFYENRLVRDSIFEQTGKRYLTSDITSDSAQYQYLMDNALALKDNLKLTPYVSLSADQVAALTKDIVWMETREVNGQKVLVPVVYIANAALAKTTDNSAKIIAANKLNLSVDTLTNQGDIKASNDVSIIASKNIYNEGGTISSGENMALLAGDGIYNISSELSAKALSITADTFQSDIASQDLTHTYAKIGSQNSELLSEASKINVTNDVTIQTTNNLSLIGTTLNAGGALTLSSTEGNIVISSKTHEDAFDFKTRTGYEKGDSKHEIGSSITANSISMNSDTLLVNASDVTAQNDMFIKANTIAIIAGEDRVYTDSKYKVKGNFFGGGVETADTIDTKTVIAATLKAKNINLNANQVNLIASKIKADEVKVTTEVLRLISEKDSSYESHFSDTSGLMTRTIASKGHIKEDVVQAQIQVNKHLILNEKDISEKLQTDNLVKILSSQQDLTQEQIELVKAYTQSKEWDESHTSLTGLGSIVVASVVSVMTAGAGMAIAGTTTQTIASAVTQSLVTGVTNQLATAAITGESFKLDVNSLVKGAVTAGVLSYASGAIDSSLGLKDVKPADMSFTQQLQRGAANTLVKSTVNSVVYGTDFGDSLKMGLATDVSNVGFRAVGDVALSNGLEDGSFSKAVLHGVVGGASSTLMGGDFASGVASGAMNELASPLLNGLDDERQQAISGFIGGVAAGAVGGDSQVTIGQTIAQSATEYNRQLHEKEVKFIEENAKEYAKKYNIDESEARKLFYAVGRSLVDEKDNKTLTQEVQIKEYLSQYLGINTNQETLNQHLAQITDIILTKSEGLYFHSVDSPSLDNNRYQGYFTSTDEQYKNHTLYPYTNIGAMQDTSYILYPSVPLLGNTAKAGNTLGKATINQLDDLYLKAGIKTDSFIHYQAIPGVKGGYYNLSNKFLSNPTKYTQGGLDFVESYLPGVPAASTAGAIGGGIGNLYGWEQLYNDLKNLNDK